MTTKAIEQPPDFMYAPGVARLRRAYDRRHDWLRRYEAGEMQRDIAINDGSKPSYVSQQISVARMERRERQLASAIQQHGLADLLVDVATA